MREIKFEAWDDDVKRIVKIFSLDLVNETASYFSYDGLVEKRYGNLGHDHFPIKLRQYTGLKDKNGKEIYEDDIIQIKGHPFEGAIKIDNNYRVSFNERMELCAGSWLLHRVLYCSEVIGNIYEHPHLLEGRDAE